MRVYKVLLMGSIRDPYGLKGLGFRALGFGGLGPTWPVGLIQDAYLKP